MGDVAFSVVKVGFVALLWVFVLIIGNIIRTDVFAKSHHSDTEAAPNPKRRGRKQDDRARLVVVAGSGVGDSVPLTGDITLGRAGDCTMDIEDDFASGHHARLYRDDQSWIIADTGSTNGTYINGVHIARATRVGEGDIIRIGRTQLKIEA